MPLREARPWAKLALTVLELDPDLALRQAAIARALELRDVYDDLVPRAALLQGFTFRGARISFGSFQRGIHRPKEMRGPAALSLMTAPAGSRQAASLRRRVRARWTG